MSFPGEGDVEEMDDIPLDSRPMVNIRNVWKSYNGTDYILKGLNMTIPKGQIYSLLGSSGVGKTTLLKCITGILTVDAGQLQVDVDSRLKLGYMPQELTLYIELTLRETFRFFGMIYYMSKEEIVQSTEKLTALLDLPSQETQISSLSGGQQRRVSIAVAMLKSPDFLILDEPTASLDPLLKKITWDYFKKISKEEGKTILLTTHYIEEAKYSDNVAFMSDGRILLEGNPADVMSSSIPQTDNLEEIYFRLCHNDEPMKSVIEFPKNSEPVRKLYESFSNYSLKRILAFSLKSLYYIRRNILIFYLLIFSPAIMTIFMTEAVKKPKDLDLGYVNYENDCLETTINCSTPLSCRYLGKLKGSDFGMVKFNTVEEGKEAVKRNKVWGMVRFNSNFSEGVVNRLDYFYATEHVEVSDDDEATVWLDMSSYIIGHLLQKHMYDSYLESLEEWYTDCGWNVKSVHPIIRIEEPIYGKVDESMITSCSPGITIVMVFSVGVELGLVLVLIEKELGTLERCRVSGLKTSELLVSQFLFCFCGMIPMETAQLAILYLYSGPSNGPLLWTIILVILQAVGGILLGMLIGLLAHNLSDALQISVAFMTGLYYGSGLLWPIEGAHWLTKIAYIILPSTVATGSMIIMANRGTGIEDPAVYWGLISSTLWIAIFLALIAIYLFQRSKKR